MDRFYGICCVLISAYLMESNGATLGKTTNADDNAGRVYANNPFFNSSSPEQYRFPCNPDHHHHHHGPYHNQKDMTNSSNDFVTKTPTNDFVTPTPQNHFLEAPKIAVRRAVGSEAAEENSEDISSNYPYKQIRKFLDSNPLLKKYFIKIPQLGTRGGGPEMANDLEDLCKMQTITTYYPKSLKNVNGVKKIIINDDQDYRQAIEQTRCVKEGPCAFDIYGYTSYCQQNYITGKLMIFDAEGRSGEQAVFDEFKIASCCVCKIKKISEET